MTISSALGVRFDQGRHPRARLGFILTAGDRTTEFDVMRMAPPGVGVHFTRVAMPDEITIESLATVANGLSTAARTILPGEPIDVVCYACTSGSIVIGEAKTRELIQLGAAQSRATTLVTGVVQALRALGAGRIALATPYIDDINLAEVDFLASHGVETISVRGLGLRHERDMARVETSFLVDLVKDVDRPEAQAVFLSCGALRSLDVIETCEDALGKPVICSNQAMMWHCLRFAGIQDQCAGYGTLLRAH